MIAAATRVRICDEVFIVSYAYETIGSNRTQHDVLKLLIVYDQKIARAKIYIFRELCQWWLTELCHVFTILISIGS
jgi:hypothetical protein